MNKANTLVENEADYHDQVASRVELNDKLIKELIGYDSPAGYTANHLPRLKKELLYVLGNVSDRRVLVYGCGNDSAALWFAKSGAYVDAIDISPKSIENQKMMAKKSGLAINYHVMDAHDLNFPDNAFDIVYGNAILHHLELDKATTEIRRVMNIEGTAIFRDVLQGNLSLRLFRHFTPNWRTRDEHPLTPNDLNMFSSRFSRVEISTFILTALPYLFFSRIMNRVVLKKVKVKARIPTTREIYSFFDRIDQQLFRFSPVLQSKAWLCLLVMRKSGAQLMQESSVTTLAGQDHNR